MEVLRFPDDKKNPPRTVGTLGEKKIALGASDLIIMNISAEVKSYLKKTYNLLTGTDYGEDGVGEWRLYAFFRVPSDCPYVFKGRSPGDEEGLSLIQRMRRRAVGGELPTSLSGRCMERENECGEGKKTFWGGKGSLRSNAGVLREEISPEELERSALRGKWNMDYELMLRDCKEICDKYRYTEVNRSDGRIVTHKGRVWRGTRYNTMLAKSVVSRYNQWRPLVREAVFVTVAPYRDDMTGNIVDNMRGLVGGLNRMSKRMRDKEGALVFRALEWADGAGLHAHLLVATCEERPDWADVVRLELEHAGFGGCSDVREWTVGDSPWYMVKTCRCSVEKIAEEFEGYDAETKRASFSAWVVWNACRLAKVQQFVYPHVDPVKESALPERKPRRDEVGREDLGKYFPRLTGKTAETRDEAVGIFGRAECASCHKVCGVADWLQKYVFGDNSLRYKTLGEFVRGGFE